MQLYRARIGLHYSRQAKVKCLDYLNYFDFLVIMSLLLIGGIEKNPGPHSDVSLNSSSSGPTFESTAINMPASVAQLDAPSDWRPGGRGFNPRRGRQHSFVEIDHEIFSTVILPLPLIQEGQLSVSGERMCTILVNHLED